MPLIRDYTYSDKVQRLSIAAEVLFVRLLLKADVAGNFYGNPELIKSLCFPLKDKCQNGRHRALAERAVNARSIKQ